MAVYPAGPNREDSESRRAPSDEKPLVRGINSIQLVNDGKRWWIASVAWDTEREDNPIPPMQKEQHQ